MFIHPSLESIINYLNHKDDLLVLPDSFQAIRTEKEELLFDREESIKYISSLRDDISDIKIFEEDSHYIMYFFHNSIKYISKFKMNYKGELEAIITTKYDESKTNIVLEIEYDGKNYYGMQKQKSPKLNTIQDELITALKKMIKKDVDVIISSRTDRGVHAKAQVVQFESFSISPDKYKYALNNLLPSDIRIKNAYSRSQLFNVRYDTISKEYEYIIDTGEYSVFNKDYVWYKKVKSIDRINEELKFLIGEHDFISFSRGEKENTTRTLFEAYAVKKDEKIIFHFKGSGFLHNMIRFIVGTVVEIVNKDKGSIKEILELKTKSLDRKIAPSSGLYLIKINY